MVVTVLICGPSISCHDIDTPLAKFILLSATLAVNGKLTKLSLEVIY